METPPSPATLESLIPETCMALLAKKRLGRLAVVSEDEIHVLPVNYVVYGTGIAFRTTPSSLLAEAAPCQVTFEVDDIDEQTRRGWTVAVKGTCHLLADPDDDPRLADLETWGPGAKPAAYLITPTEVTGRHLYPTPGGS